jgi:signal transduction histidine kinase
MGDDSFTQQAEAVRQGPTSLRQQANYPAELPQNLLAELAVVREKLEAAEEKLRQLDEALATERKAWEALLKEERARIARDLHDGLAQNLYSLSLKLDILRKQVNFAPPNVMIDELSTLKKTVQANIDDVRRTIFALRPIELETLGFGPALRKYIREFGEQVGLAISLKVRGDESALPAALGPVLFRFAQEGLTNIAKHAQARHAWLELNIHPKRTVRLTIQDDGIGFDPQIQSTPNSHKMGLRQMRERITNLEGQLKLESAPAQGVILRLEIPLSNKTP